MKEFPKFKVKIKGDAGTFNVLTIDYKNLKIYIDRTCANEWVKFDRIKEIFETDSLFQ